uniref:MFS transporter n=1 Tax=Microbispora cellulosiformans TaxID=2614688 RepID=UPI0017851F18|nr:MFS transporter [Microbispora cellulosiformans]
MAADRARTSAPLETDDSPRRADRPWHVLREFPDFRKLFTGSSISLLGSSITTVALPLTAVSYLHASPAQMGMLGAVSMLPHLILGLPAGVWVDRMSYRRTLILADFARAPLLGSIPVLAMFGWLQMWQLYVVAVLAGIGGLFEMVAAQSFTPAVVPRSHLLPANSSLALVTATVNTAGSGLGGLLVTLVTAPIAIAADALSFVISGVLKTRIRASGRTDAHTERRRRSLLVEIFHGLRAVFTHPIVRAVTVAATIGALAGQMQNVVLVLYLVRTLGFSSALVGVVIAIAGAAGILGAVLATGVTRRLGHGPAFITGMLVASVAGLVLAAASGALVPAIVVVVIAQSMRGLGPPIYGVNQQTLRQAHIPPALLSRANATWRFLVYGTQVLGAALGGFFGAAAGLRATLVVSSGLMLVGTAVAWASPLRSSGELPPQEPEEATEDSAAA